MRNIGKKNYLKPVHHDILLIELMYHVFSFVAPLTCVYINKGFVNLPVIINFRDISAILLTSKNWRNLFKNYIIILSKHDQNTGVYMGFKYGIHVLSRMDPLIDHADKPWYKHVAHFGVCANVLTLNRRITGRYYRKLIGDYQYFAVSFNLTQIYIQIPYTNNYSVFYYFIDKTKFKYILHANCINNNIKTILFVTYDLPADHPDRVIIDHVFDTYILTN